MQGPDISPEALAFLNAFTRQDEPTDFSRINAIRAETAGEQAPCSERAIKRHHLNRENIQVDGVECERITSLKSGTSGGTLVYLFGGGFVVGCPFSDLSIIGAIAEYSALEVIAPKYRLAPEHPAPAAAEDCVKVWKKMSLSSAPLYLTGESAGGNIAVVITQQAVSQNIRTPDAIALLSPAVDLRIDQQLFDPTTFSDPTLHPSRLYEIATVYAPDRCLTDPSISPLFGSFKNFPPTIITTGTRDMLLAMCLKLHRQMLRAGINVECRVWEGFWHVFEYYDQYPEADESLREIAAFLNEHRPIAR